MMTKKRQVSKFNKK